MRGLKFRLNMSVLFLSASLVVIAGAVWIEYYLSQDYIKYIRSTLLQNQIAVSHTLLTGLEQTLPPAGWQDVAARLPKLVSTTQSISMVLIHPDGSVLASEPGPPGAVPVDPELVAAALDKGQAARWVSKNHLSVAVNHSPISAVLVREIDLSEQFASLQLASTRLLISVGVIALGIGLLLLTLNWWVAVRPLNQLRKAAEAVSEGDLTRRVPPALVSELEDVSLAFNRMVEQLIGQQRWLAQTVQERTRQLADANTELEQRARMLEALNDVISATTASESLQELLDLSLREAVSALKADCGGIWLGEVKSLYRIPVEFSHHTNGQMPDLQDEMFRRGLVSDWNDPHLRDPLNRLSANILSAGIRASMTVPIIREGNAAGRILLAASQPRHWTETDVSMMETIAQQLGSAAGRLLAFKESQAANRRMSELVRQSEMLSRQLTLNEAIEQIGAGALTLSGSQRGAFVLVQEGRLEPAWQQGVSSSYLRNVLLRPQTDLIQTLVRQAQPFLVQDVQELSEDFFPRKRGPQEGIRAIGAWPLVYEGRTIACFACFFNEPRAWLSSDREVMEAFARQASVALENARLFESEHEQRSLSEALREVSAAMNSTLNLNEVIDRILVSLSKVIPHEAADVVLLDNEIAYSAGSRGYSPELREKLKNWRKPLSQFLTFNKMIASERPLVIPITDEDRSWVSLPMAVWIHSYIGAPIRSRGTVIGFINAASSKAGFFSQRQSMALQAFADQAAIAIENARLFETTRERARETHTLYQAITPLLQPGANLPALARQIVHAVVREFSIAHCSILIVDEERAGLVFLSQAGVHKLSPHNPRLDGRGLVVAAFNSSNPVYSPDVTEDVRYLPCSSNTRSELSIPLRAGDEPFGVLNLESPHVDGFSEQSRRVLIAFAEQVALLLENARLLETTRRNARQMQLLNDITEVSLSKRDIGSTLDVIAPLVAGLIEADGCYITRWDPVTRHTIPTAAWGPKAKTYPSLQVVPGEQNLTSAVMDANHSIAVWDVLDSNYIDPKAAPEFPVRSLLAIPLKAVDQKLGAILVGFKDHHAFPPSEIALCEQAAGQIALVVARLASLDLATQRARNSENLRRATATLTTTLDRSQVVEHILDLLAGVIECRTLVLFQIVGEELVPLAQRNLPDGDELLTQRFSTSDPLFAEIRDSGEPLSLEDAQADPRFKNWGGSTQIHSWLGIPLMAGNKLIGQLSVGREEIAPFSQDEVTLARVFANQAGVALENATLHARVQQMAITDPLTGLYNRYGFFPLANHELERSRRTHRPLAVLMADLDHYKRVNDTYGHLTGDAAMVELAQRLRSVMRDSDLLCRFGGDEFCAVLPETDLPGAVAAAERLMETVRERPFETPFGVVNVTVTIGATSLLNSAMTMEQLIDCADQALLHAKSEGRNRVSVWECD